MANALDHRLYAAVSAFGASAASWSPDDHWSKHPLLAACVAGGCGTLPDLLEPAVNPNHRQFFHSIVFAFLVGVLMRELYRWQPETEVGQIGRRLLLLAAGTYLVHLAMDSTTSKSLPLIGK